MMMMVGIYFSGFFIRTITFRLRKNALHCLSSYTATCEEGLLQFENFITSADRSKVKTNLYELGYLVCMLFDNIKL